MPDAELRGLLKRALDARRKQAWDAAREAFRELRAASEEAGDRKLALAAEAHLALLDGAPDVGQATVEELLSLDPAAEEASALGMLLAEQRPAEPRQPETHLAARARAYRRLCRELPRTGERALELGSAHGLATAELARRCAAVHAVDKAHEMVEATRQAVAHWPNVHVFQADAKDCGLIRAHVPTADVVCLDIGGSSPVAQVLELARLYRELYQPRVLLMRCVYLNNFVAGLASSEPTYGASIWKRPDAS